jgi:hypothetical protein
MVCKLITIENESKTAKHRYMQRNYDRIAKRIREAIGQLSQLKYVNACSDDCYAVAVEIRLDYKSRDKEALLRREEKLELARQDLAKLEMDLSSEKLKLPPDTQRITKLSILVANKRTLVSQRLRRLNELKSLQS